MLEVADIVRLHGAAYRKQYGNTLNPDRKRALRDIAACRTPFFGGHVYLCDHCREKVFSYHSCKNRSCPKCHHDQTQRWLARQRDRLLPCSYFHVTFTLPAELRPLARSHPKKIYGLLMKAAADALQTLVHDPSFLGARIGALAILHTWTRAMLFHPHAHMLVTAGGLAPDGQSWVDPKHPRFLVPDPALSVIFRAKFCAGLKKAGLLRFVPAAVWNIRWVVHSQHAGRGDKVLDYLSRYVFRIAIANSRLESLDNGVVRFRYRDNQTQQIRHVQLPATEFIHRFLQHVLPKGATKVRHYGIFSPACHSHLDRARLLWTPPPSATVSAVPGGDQAAAGDQSAAVPASPSARCPHCRIGLLLLLQTLPTQRCRAP